MKKIILGLFACWTLMQARAVGAEWFTDLSKAQAQAKTENKLILLNFTAYDWVPWCDKFKKEVLDTTEFKDYADKNLVLVEADFPAKKPQAPELKKTNEALKKQFNANQFPTFVLLDKEGAEIGRQEGYEKGGAKAFIAKLDKFKRKN
jgi:thioredoxin-related protein